jgi:hypothetical protein
MQNFCEFWQVGDWGLGIGDWGLAQSPIPNPQFYSLKQEIKKIK